MVHLQWYFIVLEKGGCLPVTGTMPEFISVNDYISEVKDDISSPPTSNFVSKMPLCRQTVNELEEVRTQSAEFFTRRALASMTLFQGLSWRGRLLVRRGGRVAAGVGRGATSRRIVRWPGRGGGSLHPCPAASSGGILGFQRGTLYGYYVYVDVRPRAGETRGVAVAGWPLTSPPPLL